MSLWPSLTCAVVAVLVYWNTLDLQFTFDDKHAIRDNQDVTNLSSWLEIAKNDFWGAPLQHRLSCKSYRPLCVATFRLNYMLHELQPMGYHLVNVLLHGVVCYLYVQLCGVIFSEVWPALIAGLLFAVHPIHTEAVAGVVGRAELLGGSFFLLTILCFRQATQSSSRQRTWFVLSMVMCVLSVVSKEQGITVVAVCLVYDIFLVSKFDLLAAILPQRQLLHRYNPWKKLSSATLVRCVVFGVFGVSLLAVRLWMARGSPKFYWVELGAHGMSSSYHRCLNYLYLVFVNSWLLLSPSLLCADWSGGAISLITSLSDRRNLLTLTTFLSLAALAMAALWRTNKGLRSKTLHKQLIMALAMMIFPFIPASNLFFPVGFVVAERILYLPSMGFCLLVALGTWHLASHKLLWRPLQYCVKFGAVYLIFVGALKTIVRNRDWYSNETLAASGLKIVRTNGKLYTMLGKEYRNRQDYATCEKLYRMAIAAEPNDPLMRRKLGSVLEVQKKLQEAEMVYSDIVATLSNNGTKSLTLNRIAQNDINIYAEYALLLRKNHKVFRSNILYHEAFRLQPHSLPLLEQTLDMLTSAGKITEAIDLIDKCLKTIGGHVRLYSLLGTLLSYQNQKKKAINAWKKALSLHKENVEVLTNLGYFLHESQDRDDVMESIQVNKKVLSLQPSSRFAALHLAESYSTLGDKASAEKLFHHVLSLSPKNPCSIKLGELLMSQERYSEAVPVLLNGVENNPHLVEGLRLLEHCYTALGNMKNVDEMHRLAEKRTTDNKLLARTLMEKAAAELSHAGIGDAELAEKYLNKAVDVDPENTEAKLKLGMLIVDRKHMANFLKAKQMFESVLASDPNNLSAMLNLGQLNYILNSVQNSTKLLQLYLQHRPNDTQALQTLAVMLPRNKRCKEGVQYLLQLQQLQPLNFEEEVLLTNCYNHLGLTTQAERTLQLLQSSYTDMASRIGLKKLLM